MVKLLPIKSLIFALAMIFIGHLYANNPGVILPAILKSDASLQASVVTLLSPISKDISISVTKGVAYLSGQVDSSSDYEKAIMLAQATPGIIDVNADDLKFRNGLHSTQDLYLTAKIKGALLESQVMGKNISSWSIRIETRDGKVYLSGKIISPQQGIAIISIVKTVFGVKAIENQMTI